MVKTESVPPWLEVMRAITGLTEVENGSNPKIEGMAAYIGRKFPPQAEYAAQYTSDDIAWCGVATDFCLAVCNISGPFGPTDTDRWMWAQSFSSDPGFIHQASPVPGSIVVMSRSGGGHVTMFEEWDGNMLRCRGGNQSNCVNVSSYDPDTVIAYCWPKAGGELPVVPIENRPTLAQGDSGPDVFDLQGMLPNFTGVVDGDFGGITKDNVLRYQTTRALEVDGVVGQQTWAALYGEAPPAPPVPPVDALTPAQQMMIKQIANDSEIASYSWDDRGQAPTGWTQGMALAFAQSYKKLNANHPAMVEMSKAQTNSDKDALYLYRADFAALGMSNTKAGADTLRHLYALMLGHGMRESSGEHCCGRDQSAENYDSNTCEAGAFQTSYNAAGSSNPEFDDLMDEYIEGLSPGFLDAFAEEVSCSSSDWESYGSGRGKEFQDLCKNKPAFSAESCGLTLRNLCNHYGPIIRHETELQADANQMFQDVQDYMDESDEAPVPPEPVPGPQPGQPWVAIKSTGPVQVEYDGDIYVTVNGEPLKG